MGEKNYLFFLILCAIVSPGIGNFSEENIKEPSNLHFRKKRIIDYSIIGNRPVSFDTVPYIVSIHKDASIICGGSIMSHNIILTAAHCILFPKEHYKIKSKSPLANINAGQQHDIKYVYHHLRFDWNSASNNVALLLISPSIKLDNSPHKPIDFFDGILPIHKFCRFSGWGCSDDRGPELVFPKSLRSILVPIISNAECQSRYKDIVIDHESICAFDKTNQKCCHEGDFGGPLVYEEKLIGILSWRVPNETRNPDVFVNLAHHHEWIKPIILAHLGDHCVNISEASTSHV